MHCAASGVWSLGAARCVFVFVAALRTSRVVLLAAQLHRTFPSFSPSPSFAVHPFRRSVRLSTFAGHSHQQVLQTEFDEASERKNALSTQLVHMVQINEVEKREALRRVVEGDGQP